MMHVAVTPGQMWRKLASETTGLVPSVQHSAKAHEHCAVCGVDSLSCTQLAPGAL